MDRIELEKIKQKINSLVERQSSVGVNGRTRQRTNRESTYKPPRNGFVLLMRLDLWNDARENNLLWP